MSSRVLTIRWFQHTAARRRLVAVANKAAQGLKVSTHSRPKAAGLSLNARGNTCMVSTHSRPKAAGPVLRPLQTHQSGFNTQPPEGGWCPDKLKADLDLVFQHTAARRRLVPR